MEIKQRWEAFKEAYKAARNLPTVGLEDEELLDWLGIKETSKEKIAEVTYFTCMKMLAETIGKLPLKYYQDTSQGKIRAEPDDMTRLLTVRPNPNTTPTILWSAVEMNCQHYGNAYVWIQREITRQKIGGTVKNHGLWLLPTKDTTVLMDDQGIFQEKGKLYYQYNDPYTGEVYVFPQYDVMHFKTWYSMDGIMGTPVRKILGDTVDGALESQNFMNNLYKQGLTASMAMQYVGDLDEKKRKQLQNKFGKYLTGSKNAGKIIPIPIGLQLTPLKMNLTDAQFFELRKYSALQIAGAFGIKPNQINNYEKSSYANSEMQQLAFLVDTMAYRLKMYEEEINYKAVTEDKRKENYFYKFNEKAILRTDSKTQAEILKSLVSEGIYSRNEARDYMNLPKKEGGDMLTVNGNAIPLVDVGKQYERGGEKNKNGTN